MRSLSLSRLIFSIACRTIPTSFAERIYAEYTIITSSFQPSVIGTDSIRTKGDRTGQPLSAKANRRACGVTSVLPQDKTSAQGRSFALSISNQAAGVHFDAPPAQVEAAGSPPAERKIGHPILDVLLRMERATGLEPATGIPRMAHHSREPCPTSYLTRLRRRWRQRVRLLRKEK